MNMAGKTGLKAAISSIPRAALGLDAQRSMFGAGGLGAAPPIMRRGRGRPPGSRNKRTIAALGILTKREGDALEELARIALAQPAEIAREWSIDREQAANLKVAALKELAEYQHVKRRHLTLDAPEGLFGLAIFNGGGGERAALPAPGSPLGPISALFPKGEPEQRVIDHEPGATDAAPTDAAGKGKSAQ